MLTAFRCIFKLNHHLPYVKVGQLLNLSNSLHVHVLNLGPLLPNYYLDVLGDNKLPSSTK
jgi:hypothetical protein